MVLEARSGAVVRARGPIDALQLVGKFFITVVFRGPY